MKLFHRKHDTTEAGVLADEIATVEHVMASYPEPRPLSFGAPTRCPACGEWGLVDDVRGGVATNHCYRCGEAWLITARALRAVAAAQDDPSRRGIPASDKVTVVFDETTAAPVDAAATPRLQLSFANRPRVQVLGA